MRYRQKVSKKRSKKMFRKSAGSKPQNRAVRKIKRGGWRM